jgi:hypothetical protein
MPCVVALGWPGEISSVVAGSLMDVLVALTLVGLVCWLAAAATRHRKEKAEDLARFKADCR